MYKFIKESDPEDKFNRDYIELMLPEADDIHELTEAYRRFLLAVGFQPGSIANVLDIESTRDMRELADQE